jgi:hypothetical protein
VRCNVQEVQMAQTVSRRCLGASGFLRGKGGWLLLVKHGDSNLEEGVHFLFGMDNEGWFTVG